MSDENPTPPPSPEFLAEDRGMVLVGIGILFLILDTLIVGLRFWAVHLIKQRHSRFTLDDVVIALSWLFNIGLCIVGFVLVQYGGSGRHQAWIMMNDPTKMVHWYKCVLASEMLCYPAIALPKVSVLLLYLRVFTDKPSRIIAHCLIYILLAYIVAFSIATGLQCIPLEYQWNPTIPGGGSCFNVTLFWKSLSFPNIITDVIIMILPLPMVFSLQLSTGRKIGVLVVLLSGSLGLIAACIRMASFFSVKLLGDPGWDSVELIGWTIAEPGIYLFAACIVQLRPLFSRLGRAVGLKSQYATGSKGNLSGGRNVRLESFSGRRTDNTNKADQYNIHGDASSITNVMVTRDITVNYDDDASDRDSSNDWTTHNARQYPGK